ncbi:hypothetical protein XENOCAPTIV_002121 [Xenoophorus captivus]|uniref:Rho-GAP domain-containing protein n=1 Tax=Xenoophorus captivus TaxID=1517983 RepID=A0ABV0RN84_9TELE
MADGGGVIFPGRGLFVNRVATCGRGSAIHVCSVKLENLYEFYLFQPDGDSAGHCPFPTQSHPESPPRRYHTTTKTIRRNTNREGVAEHKQGGTCRDCVCFHGDENSELQVFPWLQALLVFLRKVVSHQDQNRMSLWNVSMVMAPNLFTHRNRGKKLSITKQRDEMEEAVGGAHLIGLMIRHQDLLWTVPNFLLAQVRQMNQASNQRKFNLSRTTSRLLRRKNEKNDRNQEPSEHDQSHFIRVHLSRSPVSELCEGVIRVHAPLHTKVSMAIQLDELTTAKDVTTRFESETSPAQYLYEVGGNICKCLDDIINSRLSVKHLRTFLPWFSSWSPYTIQVLFLGSHGSGLQRLGVAVQRIQLLPLAVHVVLMTLEVRRLKQQSGTELSTSPNNHHCIMQGAWPLL